VLPPVASEVAIGRDLEPAAADHLHVGAAVPSERRGPALAAEPGGGLTGE